MIARYLAGPDPHGLALGCGHHPPAGWLATDLDPTVATGVMHLDVTASFPFPDASFDRIHSEHLVEHIPLVAADAGPSPEGAAYVAWVARTFAYARLEARPADVLNHGMRAWGHVFLYDERTLRDELARAGFGAAVRRCAMNESDDPALRGLETHAQRVGGEPHVAWETMVLEAMHP